MADIKCVDGVDSISATSEETLDLVFKSMEPWVEPEEAQVKVEPIINTPMPGNNPFKAIVNQWAGYIHLKSGEKRRFRHWIPDQGTEVRASIVLSHGYADHTGRYHHVAKFFCDHGFQMIAIDHKYHGDDPNYVGWKIKEIKSFDEFRDDISEVISTVELKYPDLPYFVLGHSMGGLIALMSTLQLQDSWSCKGLVLSAPAVHLTVPEKIPDPYLNVPLRWAARVGATVAPLFEFARDKGGFDGKLPEVKEAIENDEKSFGGSISARFMSAFLLGASLEMKTQGLFKISAPFFVLSCEDDPTCDPIGAKELFDYSPADDKRIKLYPGSHHESLNGPMRDEVMADMLDWVEARMD